MGKLTALRVRSLVEPGRYGDGDGLWLQVRDASRRAWLFRYRWHGRARAMGLGHTDDVSLAEARDSARDCRALLQKGVDPIEHRKKQRTAAQLAVGRSFKDVVDLFIEAHEAGWRNAKHAKQVRSSLDHYAMTKLGTRPVADISTEDVLAVLQPIWTKVPETASRVRGRIEAILDFAKARGWREAENAARWRGHLKNLLPAKAKISQVKHHAAMPYADAPAFIKKLRKHQAASIAARALEFTILTWARTGEVIGARWEEFDLEKHLWTIPASRMKSGRPHRVPISGDASFVLMRMYDDRIRAKSSQYVFPGPKPDGSVPLSNMAMTALLRRMGYGHFTVHGFRSTARDWAAEKTDYPQEVAEAALAHTLPDKVEAAYRRGDLLDKRTQMLADWEQYLDPQTWRAPKRSRRRRKKQESNK